MAVASTLGRTSFIVPSKLCGSTVQPLSRISISLMAAKKVFRCLGSKATKARMRPTSVSSLASDIARSRSTTSFGQKDLMVFRLLKP